MREFAVAGGREKTGERTAPAAGAYSFASSGR